MKLYRYAVQDPPWCDDGYHGLQSCGVWSTRPCNTTYATVDIAGSTAGQGVTTCGKNCLDYLPMLELAIFSGNATSLSLCKSHHQVQERGGLSDHWFSMHPFTKQGNKTLSLTGCIMKLTPWMKKLHEEQADKL